MLETAIKTIKKYNMLNKGDGVVVGLSGGADSCALFHLLLELQEEYELRLYAVHVNHGLRGAEADRDEAFVRRLCSAAGVRLTVESFDVAAYARKNGMGGEEAGRLLRYEAFARAAEAGRPSKTAVAHNMNDNAETFIMRACRGSGLKGLCGIPPVRGSIIRPLIECSRQQIERYMKQGPFEYITDSTNLEPVYTRNRVRLDIIPALNESVNMNAAENIARTSRLLSEDEDFIEGEAGKAYSYALERAEAGAVWLSREGLKKLHPAVFSRVIRRAVLEVKGGFRDISSAHIESAAELVHMESGRRAALAGGVAIENEYGSLRVSLSDADAAPEFHYEIAFNQTIFIKELGKYVHLSSNSDKKVGIPPNVYTKAFDYDKIKNSFSRLDIRTRRAGDKIATAGGTKKLKKLFIDMKIPRSIRNRALVLAGGGEALWVEGTAVSASFAADGKTVNKAYFYLWEA